MDIDNIISSFEEYYCINYKDPYSDFELEDKDDLYMNEIFESSITRIFQTFQMEIYEDEYKMFLQLCQDVHTYNDFYKNITYLKNTLIKQKKDVSIIRTYLTFKKHGDEKIEKNVKNLDKKYFTKNMIINHYIKESNIKQTKFQSTKKQKKKYQDYLLFLQNILEIEKYFFFLVAFYDINTLCRMFRKFDFSKNRVGSCDSNNKSLKNIITYTGHVHTRSMKKFIQSIVK